MRRRTALKTDHSAKARNTKISTFLKFNITLIKHYKLETKVSYDKTEADILSPAFLN
jgi:hypothetical protein